VPFLHGSLARTLHLGKVAQATGNSSGFSYPTLLDEVAFVRRGSGLLSGLCAEFGLDLLVVFSDLIQFAPDVSHILMNEQEHNFNLLRRGQAGFLQFFHQVKHVCLRLSVDLVSFCVADSPLHLILSSRSAHPPGSSSILTCIP